MGQPAPAVGRRAKEDPTSIIRAPSAILFPAANCRAIPTVCPPRGSGEAGQRLRVTHGTSAGLSATEHEDPP